jgi:hypothetical protein
MPNQIETTEQLRLLIPDTAAEALGIEIVSADAEIFCFAWR